MVGRFHGQSCVLLSLSRRALLASAAGHQEAEALLGGSGGSMLTMRPFVHDGDAVGERADLVQLGRDEQHRRARVALGDELAVDELDGADIHAARGLRGEQHARLAADLARDDDLLLVAAGERAARVSPRLGVRMSKRLIRRLRPAQDGAEPQHEAAPGELASRWWPRIRLSATE